MGEAIVYLRFTSSDAVQLGLRDGKAVHRGIFGPAYRVRRDPSYPLYLRRAVTVTDVTFGLAITR